MICDLLDSRRQRNTREYFRQQAPDIDSIGFHHENTAEVIEKRIAADDYGRKEQHSEGVVDIISVGHKSQPVDSNGDGQRDKGNYHLESIEIKGKKETWKMSIIVRFLCILNVSGDMELLASLSRFWTAQLRPTFRASVANKASTTMITR